MAIEIIDVEQETPQWHLARAGIPTASNFATVMASGNTPGSRSLTRDKYMRTMAGEIITGQCVEGYRSADMERGNVQEAEIRRQYAFDRDVEPKLIGFVRNGQKGYSPDSFIGNDGLLEVKSKIPDLLIECILADRFPPGHKAQCQGGLWVAEREWCDIAIGWVPFSVEPLPLFIKREYRDERYILDLKIAVDKFNNELADLVEKVRRYGAPAQAKAA